MHRLQLIIIPRKHNRKLKREVTPSFFFSRHKSFEPNTEMRIIWACAINWNLRHHKMSQLPRPTSTISSGSSSLSREASSVTSSSISGTRSKIASIRNSTVRGSGGIAAGDATERFNVGDKVYIYLFYIWFLIGQTCILVLFTSCIVLSCIVTHIVYFFRFLSEEQS